MYVHPYMYFCIIPPPRWYQQHYPNNGWYSSAHAKAVVSLKFSSFHGLFQLYFGRSPRRGRELARRAAHAAAAAATLGELGLPCACLLWPRGAVHSACAARGAAAARGAVAARRDAQEHVMAERESSSGLAFLPSAQRRRYGGLAI